MLVGTGVALTMLGALGACKNGSNNGRDTSGMTNSAAAGQVAPPPPATDTTQKDSTKADTTKPRP